VLDVLLDIVDCLKLSVRLEDKRNSHALRRNDEFWWCDDMEVVSTGPTDGRNGPFHVIALDLRAVVYYKKLDLRAVVR
jgi:hypothetical protein